jgi:hypothetical protein
MIMLTPILRNQLQNQSTLKSLPLNRNLLSNKINKTLNFLPARRARFLALSKAGESDAVHAVDHDMFNWAGVGFNEQETHALNLQLKNLAASEPTAQEVR